MSDYFDAKRWDSIKDTYGKWWAGTLERPLLQVMLKKEASKGKEPDIPLLSQANCNDLSIPASRIVDRIEYELSQYEYLGDAFPYFSMDCFGPGIVAAFLGAKLDNTSGRVWFHPKELLPIEEIHFEYDPENIWLNRIKEIFKEAMSRWQGRILMGMPDLGGTMDVLSTFRPSENLLLDLYDSPEEVTRLIWEIHVLWHRYFQELNDILLPSNPGYTNWSSVYCNKPFYILQSDFAYMISPGMFDEFIRPELAASCQKLSHSIYHLDGVGQLAHLDLLLSIKELDAVQWVPGDGKPDLSQWPEVFKKISAADKGLVLYGGFDCLDTIIDQVGKQKGILYMNLRDDISRESQYRKALEKYGIQ